MRRFLPALVGLFGAVACTAPAFAYEIDPLTRQPLNDALSVRVRPQAIETVAVSLGGDGALLVTAAETIHARATITAPLSTVGAGDCMLAGLLHGLSSGLGASDALAAAVTWGAAAVTLPGSRVPTPDDLAGIPVELTHSPALTLVLGH